MDNEDFNSFTLRIIAEANVEQNFLLRIMYSILDKYNISHESAESIKKGKYIRYRISVSIAKEFKLELLYKELGDVSGIKTVI